MGKRDTYVEVGKTLRLGEIKRPQLCFSYFKRKKKNDWDNDMAGRLQQKR